MLSIWEASGKQFSPNFPSKGLNAPLDCMVAGKVLVLYQNVRNNDNCYSVKTNTMCYFVLIQNSNVKHSSIQALMFTLE